MNNFELDIDKIDLISKEKEEENFEFRIYLKGQNFVEIDKIVQRLNNDISSQIDCLECGNCCKSLRPYVSDFEIKKLSKLDHISTNEFKSKFIEMDDYSEINYLKDIPCKYLKGKSCLIYSDRPEDCKSYPHTQKSDFISRTIGMIENYGICPIVFNVYESLKKELSYL